MKQTRNSTTWRILVILMVFGTFVSCTKNFEKINTPWNGSPSASPQQLYTGFLSNLFTTYGDQATMNGWWYPLSQQGVVYTRSDYSYDGGPASEWSNFYHNLSNYNTMMDVISSRPDSATFTNLKAMMKVLRAYQAIKLSNFYGDMPYSKAGLAYTSNPATYKIAYDSQQAIYVACLNDLAWAINHFSATDGSQVSLGSADLILQNNIPQWIKFANSFRLRVALTMYDKDQADATPHIADALNKPLLSDYSTDNVGFYPNNIPNLDLGGREFSFGQECRLRMGTTMWKLMSSNNNLDGSGIFDLRCKIFFEPNNAGQWNPFPQNPSSSSITDGGDPYNKGIRDLNWANKNGNGTPPTVNNYADFNYYWGRDKNIPELLMTAAEVHFLKAEVYIRGIAGIGMNPSTAQTEYNAGIAASLNFWTQQAMNSLVWLVNKPTGLPSQADITAYQQNVAVKFDAANPSNALTQVYAQEWIDLFRQPWEAWTLMRRTGGKTPMETTNSNYYTQTYGSYQRVQYPASEQSYNFDNWKAATSGGDLMSTKLWITK